MPPQINKYYLNQHTIIINNKEEKKIRHYKQRIFINT
jgi:hypothetical protein